MSAVETAPATPARPRSKEADELGDAVVRMMRALVARAGEGDTIAIEQLQRIDQLSTEGLRLGLRAGHAYGYSWGTLGAELRISRQAAQQLAGRAIGIGHVLVPGHNKRTCEACK